MKVITFMIAVLALVIALVAFQRTGGIEDLLRQVETLASKTGTVSDQIANMFDRFERLIRGNDKPAPPERSEATPPPQ
jgi:hypothetical protein